MKQLSEKTVGGRIRKVRIDQGMTLKEFANAAGIASNHLSLVERGEKPASDPLLKKIADATNVSRDWLRNGDNDIPDNSVSTAAIKNSENKRSEITSLLPDIRLFLTLVLMETPAINIDSLAVMLNTTPDVIDAILAGRTSEIGEMGYFIIKVFSHLAEQLDIDAVCHKLDALSDYLRQEQLDAQRARNTKLFLSLKKYVEQKGASEVRLDGQIDTVQASFPYVQIRFQDNSQHCFEFRYFQAKWFALDDKHQAEDGYSKKFEDELTELVKSQLDDAPSNSDWRKALRIVFDDKELYEDFADKAIVQAEDDITLAAEDPTGSGGSCGFNIAAILVDSDTFTVLDEKECWPEEPM